MNPGYAHSEEFAPFPEETAKQIEHILGKSVVGYRKTNIPSSNNVFYIWSSENQSYSEFHFGDWNAIKTHKERLNDPTGKYESLCLLDGASEHDENLEQNILKLPGRQPELTVFQCIENNLDEWIGLLTAYYATISYMPIEGAKNNKRSRKHMP